MAKTTFDGLIEAVRYAKDGKLELVRAYERRGATYSDQVLLSRAQLVERLENGKKFVTGTRKELWASSFEVGKEIHLTKQGSEAFISTQASASKDQLEAVPLI